MLIFSLRYPRNKLQITFLSALVCPDTRLQPPTPQPAINSQSLLHYVAWWGEGPRPDKSTPRCDKIGLSQQKSLHKGGQVPLQKMLESYQKKRRHFYHFTNQTNSRKTQGYLQISLFFGSPVKIHSFSFRSSVWLPHDLTAIPLPCCLITLHTLV